MPKCRVNLDFPTAECAGALRTFDLRSVSESSLLCSPSRWDGLDACANGPLLVLSQGKNLMTGIWPSSLMHGRLPRSNVPIMQDSAILRTTVAH